MAPAAPAAPSRWLAARAASPAIERLQARPCGERPAQEQQQREHQQAQPEMALVIQREVAVGAMRVRREVEAAAASRDRWPAPARHSRCANSSPAPGPPRRAPDRAGAAGRRPGRGRRRRQASAPRSPAGCPRPRRRGRGRSRGRRPAARARAPATPRRPRRRATRRRRGQDRCAAGSPASAGSRGPAPRPTASRPSASARASPRSCAPAPPTGGRRPSASPWPPGATRRSRRTKEPPAASGSAAAPARPSISCRPSSAAASSRTPLARAAAGAPGAASARLGPARRAAEGPRTRRVGTGELEALDERLQVGLDRRNRVGDGAQLGAFALLLAQRFEPLVGPVQRREQDLAGAGERIGDRRGDAPTLAADGDGRDTGAETVAHHRLGGSRRRVATERRQQRRWQALDAEPGLGEAPLATGAEVGHLRECRQQQGDRAGDRKRLQPRGNGGEPARSRSRRARQGGGLHHGSGLGCRWTRDAAQSEGAAPADGVEADELAHPERRRCVVAPHPQRTVRQAQRRVVPGAAGGRALRPRGRARRR